MLENHLTPQKKFGFLVKTLRQEMEYIEQDKNENKNSNRISWTQKVLAEKTKLSYATMRKIEEGKKQKIMDDELVALANALQLTSQERIEFIIAASFIDNHHIVKTLDSGDAPLTALIDQLSGTNLPLYISDVYGDIVAANSIVTELYKVDKRVLTFGLSEGISRFNIMRFVFSDNFKNLLRMNWFTDAKSNVQYFRGESLRYRVTKYWQKTFKELLDMDKKFRQIWSYIYEEEDLYSDIHSYSYMHPDHGFLAYYATVSTTITLFGNLRSVIYVPSDDNTRKAFEKISHDHGNQIHRTGAKWPKNEEMAIN